MMQVRNLWVPGWIAGTTAASEPGRQRVPDQQRSATRFRGSRVAIGYQPGSAGLQQVPRPQGLQLIDGDRPGTRQLSAGTQSQRGGPPAAGATCPTHRHPSTSNPSRAPPARRRRSFRLPRFIPSRCASSAVGIAPDGAGRSADRGAAGDGGASFLAITTGRGDRGVASWACSCVSWACRSAVRASNCATRSANPAGPPEPA